MVGLAPTLGVGRTPDYEAIRDSILSSLRKSGMHSTRGIMAASETAKSLPKISLDFHLRGGCDARDWVPAQEVLNRHPSCLINRFL